MKNLIWTRAALAAALIAMAGLASAQTGGTFDLSWSSIDAGGGMSEGGGYQLAGSIGQPDAWTEQATGGAFALNGGFMQSADLPAPPNDMFANRIIVSGITGSTVGSNVNSTRETGEPSHDGDIEQSVWWSWTAPASGSATINTCGSGFDNFLSIYTGTDVAALTNVVSDYGSGGCSTGSEVTFPAVSGVTYQISVAGNLSQSGSIALAWSLLPAPPPNDMFANRIVISGITGSAVGSNVNATKETGEPDHAAAPGNRSVWWSWTAPASGSATFNTCGSNFDTLLAVYTGTDVAGLTTVASNDDSGTCFGGSGVTFPAVSGVTYQIAVAGFFTDSGDIALAWSLEVTTFNLVLESADFSPGAPVGVQPGTPLNISWTLGGPATDTPFWMEAQLSKTGGFTPARFGGTLTQSAIVNGYSGGTQTLAPAQTLNWLPDGIYTIVPFINRPGLGGPTESLYTDNWAPIAGKRLRVRNTQAPTCNLVVENPVFTRSGNDVTITASIRNQGPGTSPAYGFWLEHAYGTLSPEGLFMLSGYMGGGINIGALAPGAAYSYTKTGTVPANAAVAIMADSTDLVPETNEQDNWKWDGVVPGGCGTTLDLTITNASISGVQLAPVELDISGSLQWSVTVQNKSSVDSGPTWIELFPSQTGGLDSLRSGITLTRSGKISVPANSTQTFSFNQGFEGISDGIYSVIAVVNRCGVADNPGDAMSWNNGFDNIYHLPGRIILRNMATAGSNLIMSQAPLVVRTGNTVTVKAYIQSTGSPINSTFWTEAFYGQIDAETGIFTPQGQLGGGYHLGAISSGENLEADITGNVPNGDWVIGVIVDSTDLISETDETDNWDYVKP